MHYFIFPDIDTTIYQASASLNTGLDEILEVRKDLTDSNTNPKVSRILMKFDLGYVSQSVSNGTIGSNAKYYLNLYDAKPSELTTSQSLWAYPISQSWVEGEGFSSDNPATTDGASWNYKDDAETKTMWNGAMTASGGTWFSDVYGSQSLEWKTRDIRMDVTPIVDKWLDGTYANEGFIIKRSGSMIAGAGGSATLNTGSAEGNNERLGNMSFFSRQTNTIYPPKLEVEWYDTKWSTGSLSALGKSELEDLQVYVKNLRPEYKEESKAKFRVCGRGRYPTKSYSNTSSEYLTQKYFPSGSTLVGDGAYYSIVDASTDDVIVNYGTGSLLSCDSDGNYFNFWMNGLQSERYYKVCFRVVSGSGTTEEMVSHYDNDFEFKVVR
jgi:hypothetical protein